MEQEPLKEPNELKEQEEANEVQEVSKEQIFVVDELFTEEVKEKKPNFGYMVLGFFIPIVGFILYYVYKKDGKKKEADALLDGAMIGIFTFIMVLILVIGYINSLQ
ncbi:MAG: hypothetical protein ACOX02_00205 [Acholeplasmatales bacterium]